MSDESESDLSALLDEAPAFAAWREFVSSSSAPFTIPGHKRRAARLHPDWGRLLDADVPLYAGLDSMQLDRDVLGQAEALAARAWGAAWCRFSTGGSTHANQAVLLALGRSGDTVLVSRSAHRSTLSGLVLAGLRPIWLPTSVDPRFGIPSGVDPRAVAAGLADHPDAVGVVLVEPSYLGTLSDLPQIIQIAHAARVPVVVDQAWGAHLGFAPGYPQHAMAAGADAVVMSAHKTLPAFSQAALVLAGGPLLDVDRLERGFETSHTTSPSGAVLASTDASRALLVSARGRALLGDLDSRVHQLRDDVRALGVLAPGPDDVGAGRFDPAKLVLCLGPSGRSGLALQDELVAAGLPVEMADDDTVVLLATLADDDATFARLRDALLPALRRPPQGPPRPVQAGGSWGAPSPAVCSPREAFFAPHERVPAELAVGRTCAEVIAPYPPGVPVLVPGEQVTTDALERLRRARAAGLRIAYAADPTLASFLVLTEPVSGAAGLGA